MIVIEVIVLLVALIVAARSHPPRRHVAPRVMSLLAAVALLAFGVAMASIVIVQSEPVFGGALLVAGVAACAFLYLARGWTDDDDDEGEDEPPVDDPQGGADPRRRFARKRTRAPKAPAPH